MFLIVFIIFFKKCIKNNFNLILKSIHFVKNSKLKMCKKLMFCIYGLSKIFSHTVNLSAYLKYLYYK